jgi:two-component system osmolarity sensor histidine kinase EnvZ
MADADISAIAEEAALAARRGGADIEFHGAGPLVALVRAGALKRCIGNLVDNAVAPGEKVRVSARATSDAFLIEVEDDGPGIPDDLHEDAFRPFSRLDETRTKNAKGVGLGLAIARDVAKSGDGGLKASLRLPRRG